MSDSQPLIPTESPLNMLSIPTLTPDAPRLELQSSSPLNEIGGKALQAASAVASSAAITQAKTNYISSYYTDFVPMLESEKQNALVTGDYEGMQQRVATIFSDFNQKSSDRGTFNQFAVNELSPNIQNKLEADITSFMLKGSQDQALASLNQTVENAATSLVNDPTQLNDKIDDIASLRDDFVRTLGSEADANEAMSQSIDKLSEIALKKLSFTDPEAAFAILEANRGSISAETQLSIEGQIARSSHTLDKSSKAEEEKQEALELVYGYLSHDIIPDGSTESQNAIDVFYDAYKKKELPESVSGLDVLDIIKTTGLIPTQYLAEAHFNMRLGSVTDAVSAARTVTSLTEDTSLIGLNVNKHKQLISDANLIYGAVLAGTSPEIAVQHLKTMRSRPEAELKLIRDAWTRELKTGQGPRAQINRSVEQIQRDVFANTSLFRRLGIKGEVPVASALFKARAEAVMQYYFEQGQTYDEAQKIATHVLQKTWGTTSFLSEYGNHPQNMEAPPERVGHSNFLVSGAPYYEHDFIDEFEFVEFHDVSAEISEIQLESIRSDPDGRHTYRVMKVDRKIGLLYPLFVKDGGSVKEYTWTMPSVEEFHVKFPDVVVTKAE